MALTSPNDEPAGDLLDGLLDGLFDDFRHSFARGLVLLDHCPDAVMPEAERRALRDRLELANRELAAASSLRQATPAPMALEMATLAPWHQLVLSVWTLSSNLRRSGVQLPETAKGF
jgi:hypothetical protein